MTKTEKVKKLVVGVFEFWKSFPDSIRTAILVSVMGALIAFWVGDKSPNYEPALPAPPLTAQHSDERKEDLTRERASRQVAPERITNMPRTNEAEKTLELGSYAKAYGQYVDTLKSLPELERQRLLVQSEAAARSYDKGNFREAAYRMQQALNSSHTDRKEHLR